MIDLIVYAALVRLTERLRSEWLMSKYIQHVMKIRLVSRANQFYQACKVQNSSHKRAWIPSYNQQVVDAIKCPEFITKEKFDRGGAYRSLDKIHAIRVIYEEQRGIITVVTVMVVRRTRYERQN